MSEAVSQRVYSCFFQSVLHLTNHDSLLAWHIIYPFTNVSPIIVSTDGVKRLGLLSVLFLGSNVRKVANVGLHSFVIVL
jgi:hypothetical protein